MSDLRTLQAQLAELEQQIAEARKAEVATAIEQVRTIVKAYDLTSTEVFGASARSPVKRPPPPARYRDPATGNTWSGRGRTPAWLEGKDRADFAIAIS